MNKYYKPYREERYAGIRWGLWGILALALLSGAGYVVSTLMNVASAPSRVINRTLETDNIISNYEWYHDANNQVKARVAQISGHKRIAAETSDTAEKSRLRIEQSAIQQSCRDLVGRYNSNATKINRNIFMGRDAPDSLNPQICE